VSKGQLKQPALIERRIGALQKKHPKIQRFYTAIPQPEETEVLKGLLQREGGEI